jgi:hypothetical protein
VCNYAYTQHQTYSDSTQFTIMSTEATFGVYIPTLGMPYRVEKAPRANLIGLTCVYCGVHHLFDREKMEESLQALLCLGCGAPLPLPKE